MPASAAEDAINCPASTAPAKATADVLSWMTPEWPDLYSGKRLVCVKLTLCEMRIVETVGCGDRMIVA